MKIKNISLLALLSAGALVLSGCSDTEVNAQPNWADEDIIVSGIDEDTKDNLLGKIYDALEEGSTSAEKVKNDILVALSEGVYGTMDEINEVVALTADDAKSKSFIEEHEVYQLTDNVEIINKGVVDGEMTYEKSTYSAAEVATLQHQNVINLKNSIDEAVNVAIYNDIIGGAYSDRNIFEEERYVQYLRSQMYSIDTTGVTLGEGLILPEYSPEAIDATDLINIDIYTDYIERALLPEIFTNLLVQNYLMEERYSSIGRSYARELEYIHLAVDDSNKTSALLLLQEFVDANLTSGTATDFEIVADAWRGTDLDTKTEAEALLVATNAFEPMNLTAAQVAQLDALGVSHTVYEDTLLGQMVLDYLKITNDRHDEVAQSILNDFTNNGAYTPEIGFGIKLDEIKVTDHVTDGWYLKNDGIPNVSEDIKSRLFNIGVSNIVDSYNSMNESEYEFQNTDYVRYIEGEYFLTEENSQATEGNKNIVIYDGASNYYIFRIDNAISSSKLSLDEDNTSSYRYLKSSATFDTNSALYGHNIALDIAQEMSTKDSYITSAEQHYIMLSNILYHDESIYEYFKTNFPELFEDDAE